MAYTTVKYADLERAGQPLPWRLEAGLAHQNPLLTIWAIYLDGGASGRVAITLLDSRDRLTIHHLDQPPAEPPFETTQRFEKPGESDRLGLREGPVPDAATAAAIACTWLEEQWGIPLQDSPSP
jgi:hypothetical protein